MRIKESHKAKNKNVFLDLAKKNLVNKRQMLANLKSVISLRKRLLNKESENKSSVKQDLVKMILEFHQT